MKILNLYAGLGGNCKKWDREIHQVTAIESDPNISRAYKYNNPRDTVIVCDAMNYLKDNRNEFDFIWASPPCQKHSKMMKATRHNVADYLDISLYQIIIFLKHFYKGKWCVENVRPYYKPLIRPTCKMGRHFFWANFEIFPIDPPKIDRFISRGTSEDAQIMKDWLGIKYEGNIYYGNNHCPVQVLRNCVHPDIGNHILYESGRVGLFSNI